MVGVRDDKPHNPCDQPISGPRLPLDVDLGQSLGIANGHGVTIAIIDTGSATPTSRGDRDHCVLHGTAVASVASTVAPGATITAYRHSERPEEADGTVKTLVRAIDRAVHDKAKIINISMVACTDTVALRDAIGRAVKSGALVVASAGNRDQCEPGQSAYPAALPSVLSVGAVEKRIPAEVRDGHPESPGSAGHNAPHAHPAAPAAKGATPANQTGIEAPAQTSNPDNGAVPAEYSMPAEHIDIYAPGGPVSARLRTKDGATHTIIGGPDPFQGTSFASPVVAGTAALVWQLWPGATPSQIRQLLEATSIPGGADGATAKPVKVVSPARAVSATLEKTSANPEQNPNGDSTTTNPGGGSAGRNPSEDFTGNSAAIVSAQPPNPVATDYRVAVGLGAVLALAVIIAVVARALSSDNNPPSGNPATTRQGT